MFNLLWNSGLLIMCRWTSYLARPPIVYPRLTLRRPSSSCFHGGGNREKRLDRFVGFPWVLGFYFENPQRGMGLWSVIVIFSGFYDYLLPKPEPGFDFFVNRIQNVSQSMCFYRNRWPIGVDHRCRCKEFPNLALRIFKASG